MTMTVENSYSGVIAPRAHDTKISSQSLRDSDAKFERITRGLARATDTDLIRAILDQGRNPKIIWASAPTGKPHLGYIMAWVKIADFVSAGADIITIIGDIYGFLINYKYPFSMVMQRAKYYKFAFCAIFETIYGIPASKLGVRFEHESTYHLEKENITNLLKMIALTAQQDIRATGEELKHTPMLSPLLCPAVQALNQQIFDADIEFGGLDQAMIFDYAGKLLPKLGYRKRAFLMGHLLPGLNEPKMSASDPRSKIDLLDSPEVVLEKVMATACIEGVVEKNTVLAFLRLLIIPVGKIRLDRAGQPGIIVQDYSPFTVEGAPYGTVLSVEMENNQFRHYSCYKEIEDDFCARELDLDTLKMAASRAINQLLSHIRRSFQENSEWQKAARLAYPDSEEETGSHITPPADLDFCLPAALREVSNERVKLLPFNVRHLVLLSSAHAVEFVRFAAGHPDFFSNLAMEPSVSTESFITGFIENTVRPNRQMVLYAVIDKTRPPTSVDKEGALAGFLAYLNMSPANQSTEIGYVITLPQFQRTHVTSNAVGLLLNFALNTTAEGCLGLRRVQLRTSMANYTSIRTAEELGFVKEGVLRWDPVFSEKAEKQSNGRDDLPRATQGDLARDTVLFGMCWDDWFIHGRKEQVAKRMAGQGPGALES